MLLLTAPFLGIAQLQVFVAPNGSDTATGTRQEPLASLAKAIREVRELRRLNDDGIRNGAHIMLMGGRYQLDEPVFIRPEDAGTATSPTYIEAVSGEQPVLSGGFGISNWQKIKQPVAGLPAIAAGKVWVADAPGSAGRLCEFRQLWVNDQKAVRAKSMNGDLMDRILSWNKRDQTCWIPTPKTLSLQNVVGAEMFIHQWWAIAILRIKKMELHGDSTKLFFEQPESRIQSEHPWPAPWISKETGNSAFYLTNALQFLDEPGEWFLDISNHKIYYWPRVGENLLTAKVIAPSLETLVQVTGTIDHPVSNIYFNGISFQHAGWLRPSQHGHVPHQAGMYMLDAYKLRPAGTPEKAGLENQAWVGRPAAAVEVSFAGQINFENCRFEHLASTGLDYIKGVHNNTVSGNLFKDIGGTGILAGVYSDEATEIHLPYNPKDDREVCNHMTISNNMITDATNEDWSCVGIGAGYTRNTLIAHNEIENVSYTGISMGWGWSPTANAMKNNRITGNKIQHYGKHNYDCAGIYTLSAQLNSTISENYVDSIYKAPYAHLPSHWFYIYTDEGSSYIKISNNWTLSQKYLQNANGPGNEWLNNGPEAGAGIRENAGLLPFYETLAKERAVDLDKLPVNEEHSEIIELVTKENAPLDIQKLKILLQKSNMDSNAIYQWQNHTVYFGKVVDLSVMQGRLQNNFPDAAVKLYHDLVYEFSKRKHCADTATAKEWEHIVLTANLVADKKLQQEYVNHHATQFQKWPEVAKGFCNASFQQLMVFRNGRQLMLIISIPKGETLDHLNPKTNENNPRVDDWNKMMKKYQEGIEGTKPGETWVFLKPLKLL
ncbi:MAG: L-rhamnose mutarotase [Chitinophagaceae bacterium]